MPQTPRKPPHRAAPIPGAAAQWLVVALADRGVDTSALLAAAGLDTAWRDDPDATLSEAQYERLVKQVLAGSTDAALGLKIARQPNYLSRLGFWGYAVQSCADLGEALETSIRYWPLSGSLVQLDYAVQDGSVCITISPAFDFVRADVHRFAVEKVISSIAMLHEWMLGRPLPLQSVSVSFGRPAHAPLYDEHIACPVQFDSSQDRIVFSAESLRWPLFSRQPLLAKACRQRLNETLNQRQSGDHVVAQVQEQLKLGAYGFPDIQTVANAMGISARTLRRRLQDRGANFQRILDDVRQASATDYLLNTDLSIDQIACLLGFSEPTTFRSAFKRWSGQSAAGMRRGRAWPLHAGAAHQGDRPA